MEGIAFLLFYLFQATAYALPISLFLFINGTSSVHNKKKRNESTTKARTLQIAGLFLVIPGIFAAQQLISFALADKAQEASNPLGYAVIKGDIKQVRKRLEEGYSPNGKSGYEEKWDDSILSYACLYTKIEVTNDIIKLLINYGADVNAKGENGETPLLQTINRFANLYSYEWHGYENEESYLVKTIKLLTDYGADVNGADDEGRTSLMLLGLKCDEFTTYYQYHCDIATLLIEKGADVNARDKKGRTPLMYACGAGYISSASKDGFSPELIKLLVELGADVEAVSYESFSAFDYLKMLYERHQWWEDDWLIPLEENYKLALEALEPVAP